jgi:hypothetical protein
MDDTVIKHIARFTAIHADFESIVKRNWAPLLLTLAQQLTSLKCTATTLSL